MAYRRISQEQIDLISDYLANNAERGALSKETIELYRITHAGRENWSRPGLQYSKRGVHPHGSNPFCNICEEEYSAGEEVFCFYVRSQRIFYHIDCFDSAGKRKKLSIIYQDRAYRKKYLAEGLNAQIKERTWIDDVEDVHKALRKSGYEGKIG